MHITTVYETTERERLRAHNHVMANRLAVGWILCAFLLFIGPVGIWLRHETILGTSCTAAGLMVLGQLTVGRRRAVRQMAAAAQGPADITVTETSVTVRRKNITVEVVWSSVYIVETEDFLLLHQSPKVFSILVKRGFTPDQLQELRAFTAGLPDSPAARKTAARSART
ncbi:YcxB family protein [Kitasatospora indigofera]|uniref:YcxB family protein n=1 Tax=Kitasatospora indigofera TaxID=67307 RepID=UPI0033AD0E67